MAFENILTHYYEGQASPMFVFSSLCQPSLHVNMSFEIVGCPDYKTLIRYGLLFLPHINFPWCKTSLHFKDKVIISVCILIRFMFMETCETINNQTINLLKGVFYLNTRPHCILMHLHLNLRLTACSPSCAVFKYFSFITSHSYSHQSSSSPHNL